MKYFLLTIVLFFSACAGAPFKHNEKEVKANSTKIITISSVSDKETFIQLKKIVVSEGYSILTQDSDTGSFTTNYKQITESIDIPTDMQLVVSVLNNKIVWSGNFKNSPVIGSTEWGVSQIKLTGMDGSKFRGTWKELYRLANIFSNDLKFE